jgi:ATP-dependent Clp protease ATP-binding subunit ClpB
MEENDDDDRLLTEVVGPDEISEIVSRWTGIPVTKLSQTQSQRLLHLADELRKRVVGQEEALSSVADSVLRCRAGLARSNQPVSFLFLGQTGVGKTELAKALAESWFDDEKHMIRLDMIEYMEKHSVSRLIGAPPGYVGYEQGGQLTEAVRQKPYSVVLLDEVEKAHPECLNALLQLLDDGRLTDGKGRTVDFSNTVMILTSNLGAEHLDNANFGTKAKNLVMESVRNHFRPEFINRLDEIIVFSPLQKESLRKIVHNLVDLLGKRLSDRQITLELDDSAVDVVIEEAWNQAYGARPLKRYLDKTVATELSRMIVKGDLQNNSKVEIIANGYKKRRLSGSSVNDEADFVDLSTDENDKSSTKNRLQFIVTRNKIEGDDDDVSMVA